MFPRLSVAIISLIIVSAGVLPTGLKAQDRFAALPSTDVLFENEYVRVQWHDVPVGETVPMHSHPGAVVIAFGTSSVRFTFPDGTSRIAQAAQGRAYWNEPASHEVTNTGDTPVHNLMVEIKDSASTDLEATPWPEALLPLAAAPEQHRLLVDNDRVRVFEVVSPPGGIAPLHVHPWNSVFITTVPAKLLFRDSLGEVVLEAPGVTPGETLPRVEWFGPRASPRSVENADTVELRAYRVEIKSDPAG